MTSMLLTAPACARTLLLSAGLALGTAAAAQAATFTWNFGGTIGTPQDVNGTNRTSNAPGTVPATGTGFVFGGAGSSSLTWGDPDTPGTGTPINSLLISSGGDSRDLADKETADILIGWLDYTNKSVFHAGGIWYTTLSFDIALNSEIFKPDLRIKVDNTPDKTEGLDSADDLAINNKTGLNPDDITFLSLTNLDITVPLDLGGGFWLEGYFVQLDVAGSAGTREGTGTTGDVCSFGGSGSVFDTTMAKWSNCEGNTSRLGIYAKVRYDEPVAPIPLPAAGWLLLGGLAALGAAARRRRAA